MSIKNRIKQIKDSLPDGVILVAVSKTKPIEAIQGAYDGGQRIFGENRAQELAEKHSALPKDIAWHMVGHLQTNKVKYIAPFVDLIHSVDSLKLLKEINKQGKKFNRVIRCLLQFHIATESTKFGLNLDESRELLSSDDFSTLDNVCISGVMGMATNTEDRELVRREFNLLKMNFESLRQSYFMGRANFTHISMGMSGDFDIAIEEGSTMIRIGTTIFGRR